MRKQGVWVLVCVGALLTCSCASKDEVERARAEAAAAKAEVEALKASLEKEKADIEAAKAEAIAAKERMAKLQTEMMNRWNAVAGGMNFPIGNFGNGNINFRWSQVGNFPHPTFKGGSAEAYGAFAQVLVAFLKAGDNFNFLAENHLFTAELQTTVAGGSGKGTGWSFAKFAEQFSAPNAHGKLDDDTRKALKDFSERMLAIVKKQESRKL
jgi:outer membrane murein-binding lipoprotein Lpp